MINWHALTGCYTTVHIHRNGNNSCFATFMKENPTILIALACYGQGDEPSEEVVCGCEEFICSLFCPDEIHIWEAMTVRCFLFKQHRGDQGVDKLGAWIERMRCAHVQAPDYGISLDPLTLGMEIPRPKSIVPVLYRVAPAPVSVLQLLRYNCEKSKCSQRCSCRGNNVVCTELGTCVEKATHVRTIHSQ